MVTKLAIPKQMEYSISRRVKKVMEQSRIDRINELAKKKKTIGLTEAEQTEQKALYAEYLAAVRTNLRATLSNIKISE